MKTANYVKTFGVEIEGNFHALESDHVSELQRMINGLDLGSRWSAKTDGSVTGDYAYEIICAPYAHDEQGRFGEDVRRLTNGLGFDFNESAGFHVHVRLKNQTNALLLNNSAFINSLLNKCHGSENLSDRTKRLIKKRLRGEDNDYAKLNAKFSGSRKDDIFALDFSDRYVAMNYCAMPLHGTLEFRFAPAMRAREMMEYTGIIMGEINAYLGGLAKTGSLSVRLNNALMEKLAVGDVEIAALLR